MNQASTPQLPRSLLAAVAAAALPLALLALGACATAPAGSGADTAEAPAPPSAPLPDLWEAAGVGDVSGLEAHRSAGTNLDSLHPETGVTPLAVAIGVANNDAARWLLDNGATVDARNRDGGTALFGAIFLGRADGARLLLERGADPALRNGEGLSLQDVASADWQTTSYILGLLELDIERQALEAGRQEILALLRSAQSAADPDDIWAATAAGNADAVRRLIAGGIDVNKREPSGSTLLTIAAIAGQAEVAELLLEAGADVNGRNYQNGSTALHAAAFIGQADMVALLLERGADPQAMSDDGGTPLTLAELDWGTTQYVAAMLQVPVEEETTMAGKAKAAELLRARL